MGPGARGNGDEGAGYPKDHPRPAHGAEVRGPSGRWHCRVGLDERQPSKLAAFELAETTESPSPLRLGGVLVDGEVKGSIDIPRLGSLIEVVNRFGSFFYGSILGVFMLAILTRRATGNGAFIGLLTGMAAVAAVAFRRPDISFLWHNVIGAFVVFVVGMTISLFDPSGRSAPARP